MADKQEKLLTDLSKQLKEVKQRLSVLESGQSAPSTSGDKCDDVHQHAAMLGACNLPPVPERTFAPDVSAYREGLLRYIGKKWVNGTKLKYYFFTNDIFRGEPSNVALVRSAFEAWTDIGIGIEFEETTSIDEAEVRIGFQRGDGAWSYVGRDVIDIPGQQERTMNFGWDLTQDPRGGGLDTPIHEIGHTLGFPHEHQNPFAGIVWDEDAVYREFGGSPNFWSRAQIDHNILRKLNANEVEGSDWDPNSIMHYSFGPGLIVEPEEYRSGLRPTDGLTEADIAEVRKFYPPLIEEEYVKLDPYRLEFLSVGPGEQKNFVIQPQRSDEYTIQTFGRSDSVMVLFEDVDGELEFVAGDDDSGTATNARLTERLVAGRKYILRIRLFLNWASGNTAVLMWN